MKNYGRRPLPIKCMIKDRIKSIKKMKNTILAIPTAVDAIPPKPNTPAIIAMIKKIKTQLNIKNLL